MNVFAQYFHWLHLQWPAGTVETLPVCDAEGRTNIDGITIVGDLTGTPLLKFALQSGARAARRVATELSLEPAPTASGDTLDLVIIGGGVAGMSAAIESLKLGLRFRVVESAHAFATIASFPAKKPIFTYPSDMQPEATLQATATVKEALLSEFRSQTRSHDIPFFTAMAREVKRSGNDFMVSLDNAPPLRTRKVIVALGRSGARRRLNVPGEELPHVLHRLIDPAAHKGQHVVVVGGGDSAAEAALALAQAGATVTLVHRGAELTRVKAETQRALQQAAARGAISLRLAATVEDISTADVGLLTRGEKSRQRADQVLVLVGRDAPLDFFRRSGLALRGEYRPLQWAGVLSFAAFALLLYTMKAFGLFSAEVWHPSVLARLKVATLVAAGTGQSLWATILASASNGIGFYITLLYSLAVVVFGIDRIRKRKTPYVYWQTLTLILVQCVLLFILPEILLPWLGRQGVWDNGIWRNVADALFPRVSYDAHGREYWRAYGFVLAWPLFVWNVLTSKPHFAWLVISCVQTFVIIPLIVWRWGKGAYCGWICSCGALAETLGDRHREKMPHGPFWNRLNLIGQVILAAALGLLVLRVVVWTTNWALAANLSRTLVIQGWKPIVDYALAGVLGTGLYFGFSGRLWCRFACPLAALMHVYARFSRFRILADGKKCISCNACTTTCHQGIDVMGFASRGAPMEDPQCVRCSACVQVCPTGVLQFGQVNRQGQVLQVDRLSANSTV
ncbi:MAG: NAD(P)-binding domain-containing protein [Myxococcaceae bacterium]